MFSTNISFICVALVVVYCESQFIPKKFMGKTGFGSNRRSRFLSLFTYVHFENQECIGANGESGTCLSPSECTQKGGSSTGTCAGGYGACCMILATCGDQIRENGTFFVNKGYPESFDGTESCQVTLQKTDPDICQFRLDFDILSLMGPEPINHICDSDQFIVSGGSLSVPPICGFNTGNHVYVNVDRGEITSPVVLSVVTSGSPFERSWRIRVRQIPCSTNYKAEDGCLQYFTGVSGQIKSFNYDPLDGRQLSNQDYSICVRAERNFCGIQYTQCRDETVNGRNQSFTLSGNSNNPVPSMVGSTGNSNFCPADYILIPMATNVGRPVTSSSSSADRMCGGLLSADVGLTPSTVRSTVKPFILWFHTDGVESPIDIDNKGFCLNYVQQPCTNKL